MKRTVATRLAAVLIALGFAAPAQAQESEWSAYINYTTGVCYQCAGWDIGDPEICPCRIPPVIIIIGDQ